MIRVLRKVLSRCHVFATVYVQPGARSSMISVAEVDDPEKNVGRYHLTALALRSYFIRALVACNRLERFGVPLSGRSVFHPISAISVGAFRTAAFGRLQTGSFQSLKGGKQTPLRGCQSQ